MQTPWCCPRQVTTTWVNRRARCRDVRPPGEGPASAQGRQRQLGSQCHTGTVASAPTLAAANVQGTGTSIAGAPGAAIFSAGRMTGASVWLGQRRGAAEGGTEWGSLRSPLSRLWGPLSNLDASSSRRLVPPCAPASPETQGGSPSGLPRALRRPPPPPRHSRALFSCRLISFLPESAL